ncbi:right-handed parallel beta-helix repeat-containing protein [Paenibacillus turpanensis]|uniref:right-handed parallel beta-helix repeat-containing protein n=1 Tax=Paenibacillus turpanensis TaxID=2689078 RepID=UPI00140D866F|nr:right-handed parallel beta-helix repeat-containing protein [Paenibacillus turpanensis]
MIRRTIKLWSILTITVSSVIFPFFPQSDHAAIAQGDYKKTYFVSPHGSDKNPGTEDAPFQTLERARNEVRNLKQKKGLPDGGVTIYLREGTYRRNDTFILESLDSGKEGKPIVYSSYPGEKVQIAGGVTLSGTDFKPVSDPFVLNRLQDSVQDQVFHYDLHDAGYTDYGTIEQVGMGLPPKTAAPELFIDEKPMTLSRYPNEGYVTVGSVIDAGGNPRSKEGKSQQMDLEMSKGAVFNFKDSRPTTWENTGDLWMFGYWYWDWADGNLNIQSIDSVNISTKSASFYSIRQGQRYYYYNILEELDIPGEWYLDRKSGKLYLIPPSNMEQAKIQLSLLGKPLVKMEETSYIQWKDISFQLTRDDAIIVNNGEHNLITGCELSLIGRSAVKINNGRNNSVLSSEIHDTGNGGISLTGGNRETLEPGRNTAKNNHIYRYSRLAKTYAAAVSLSGVGNTAENNYIHDAPHLAIRFDGNDHIIEYNEISNVMNDTGDGGAIYTGRDWTERGNIIRYNYLHDINNSVSIDQFGIYLDDLASGTHAHSNIFYNVDQAFMIGGGRSNIIENNVIMNSSKAFRGDNRGMTWYKNETGPGGVLYKRLNQVPYQSSVWSKYSNLANILQDEPEKPKHNEIKNNVVYQSSDMFKLSEAFKEYSIIKNNIQTNDKSAQFVNEATIKPISKPKSTILRQIPSFKEIPVDKIGLYIDEHRTKLHGKSDTTQKQKAVAFYDSFEEGLGNWKKISNSQENDLPVTIQSYRGISSFSPSGDVDVITNTFAHGQNKVLSLRFYDNAEDKSMKVIGRVDDGMLPRALGVDTTITETNYVYRIDDRSKATSIPRSTGWHEFVWVYTSGSGVDMYIDGEKVATATGVKEFNFIALGDYWEDQMTAKVFFDDVEVEDKYYSRVTNE